MSYRPDKQKLTDTQIHTHTDTGDDNTRRPKGPRVKRWDYSDIPGGGKIPGPAHMVDSK